MVNLNKTNPASQTSNAQALGDVQLKRKLTKEEEKVYFAALNSTKNLLGKYGRLCEF